MRTDRFYMPSSFAFIRNEKNQIKEASSLSKEYSIRELIAILGDLEEDGYRSISYEELVKILKEM